MLMVIRITLTLLFIAEVLYGRAHFPGKNEKSARYLTHPEKQTMGPIRFFNDDEWTAEGLEYRSRFIKWWAVTVATTIALMISLFAV